MSETTAPVTPLTSATPGDSAAVSARARRAGIALRALQVALALFYGFASALPKLIAHPSAVESFDRMGWGSAGMYTIGLLELAGAVALLVPALQSVAAMALSALMVGRVRRAGHRLRRAVRGDTADPDSAADSDRLGAAEDTPRICCGWCGDGREGARVRLGRRSDRARGPGRTPPVYAGSCGVASCGSALRVSRACPPAVRRVWGRGPAVVPTRRRRGR